MVGDDSINRDRGRLLTEAVQSCTRTCTESIRTTKLLRDEAAMGKQYRQYCRAEEGTPNLYREEVFPSVLRQKAIIHVKRVIELQHSSI